MVLLLVLVGLLCEGTLRAQVSYAPPASPLAAASMPQPVPPPEVDIQKMSDALIRRFLVELLEVLPTARDRQTALQELTTVTDSLVQTLRHSPVRDELQNILAGLKSKIVRQVNAMPFSALKVVEELLSPEAKARLESGERIYSASLTEYAAKKPDEKQTIEFDEDGLLMLLWQKMRDHQATCSTRERCVQDASTLMLSLARGLPGALPVAEKINTLASQLPVLANSQSIMGIVVFNVKGALSRSAWNALVTDIPEVSPFLEAYNASGQAAAPYVTPTKTSYPWVMRTFSREGFQKLKDTLLSDLTVEVLTGASYANTFEESVTQIQRVLQTGPEQVKQGIYRERLLRELKDIVAQFNTYAAKEPARIGKIMYARMSPAFQNAWKSGKRYNPDAYQQLSRIPEQQKSTMKIAQQGVFNAFLGGIVQVESNCANRNECVNQASRLADSWKQALPPTSSLRHKIASLQTTLKSGVRSQSALPVFVRMLQKHVSPTLWEELLKRYEPIKEIAVASGKDDWEALSAMPPRGRIAMPWKAPPKPKPKGAPNAKNPVGKQSAKQAKGTTPQDLLGKMDVSKVAQTLMGGLLGR
jgi:hypothetical protein